MSAAGGIIENAAAAASAVLGQAGAPTSKCCAAGAEAFAESNAVLIAEYGIAFAELAEAETSLTAEAEVSYNGWLAAENELNSIARKAQTTPTDPRHWTKALGLVLAEANVTEAAFNLSKEILSTEIGLAAEAFGLAETNLQAEAEVFQNESGCEAAADQAAPQSA